MWRDEETHFVISKLESVGSFEGHGSLPVRAGDVYYRDVGLYFVFHGICCVELLQVYVHSFFDVRIALLPRTYDVQTEKKNVT